MPKKKILLVDDEKDFVYLAKLNLEASGAYEVKTLPNAKNIIEETKVSKPDLIIIDLVMPEIGGLEACEMLNQDPACNKIPIIVLSALGKDTDKLLAYKKGVVDYLVKPTETKEIVKAVEKALRYK